MNLVEESLRRLEDLATAIHIVVSSSSRPRTTRRAPHTSRYIRRWIPVPLITADLFRSVGTVPSHAPRGRGFDSRFCHIPTAGC